jgi:aminopeptidase N
METTSGLDLTEFFNDWLYNQGYPSYNFLWHQSGNQLHTTVSQTQSDPSVSFFETPLPIKIYGTMGEELDIILDNTTENEAFSNTVNFTISSIEFDPEADIISKNNSVTLGYQQTESPKSLMIFPNPTSNTLTIQQPENLEVNEIRIFNIIGQLFYQQNWSPIIDLTSFSTGLLFVQFQTNEGVINKSVLKN